MLRLLYHNRLHIYKHPSVFSIFFSYGLWYSEKNTVKEG